MKLPSLITTQRQKEHRTLRSLLAYSLVGSLGFHAIALSSYVRNAWGEQPEDSEIEVVIESTEEPKLEVDKAPEPASENKPATPSAKEGNSGGDGQIELATRASLKPAPVKTALKPDLKQPLPDDNALPDPKAAPTSPTQPTVVDLTSLGQQIARPTTLPGIFERSGSGLDIGPGTGRTGAVGNSNTPGLGTPGQTGDPNAIGLGNSGKVAAANNLSKPQPEPSKTPEVAVRQAPRNSERAKPTCVSCPKPDFNNREGSARLVYDIDAGGNVTNVRLRQSSGDPEVDRQTMETVKKWKFKPSETGYRNTRQRITLQERDSKFQREQDQRRAAEAERRQRSAERRQRSETEQLPARATQTEPPVKTPIKAPTEVPLKAPTNPKPVEAKPAAPAPQAKPVKPAKAAPASDNNSPRRKRRQRPVAQPQQRYRPVRPVPQVRPIERPAPPPAPIAPAPAPAAPDPAPAAEDN